MKRLMMMNGRIIGRLDEEEPDFNCPELFADLPLRDRCTHASSAGDDGPSWALLGVFDRATSPCGPSALTG